MDLEKQIIDKIIEIGNIYDEVKKITLFGSRARNDNQSRSDIDLAVYFHSKQNPNVISALEDIETLLKIDVTVITDTLDKSFLCNVKNEEVILYMGKFENKYNNFIKALNKLEQAVNQLNTNDDQFDEMIRDCLIQRFEFCYELGWKTLKDYLQYNGLTTESMPRPVFKVAFEHNLIDDEQTWLNMIKDRNVTSNECNEDYIVAVSDNIKNQYYDQFKKLATTIKIPNQ